MCQVFKSIFDQKFKYCWSFVRYHWKEGIYGLIIPKYYDSYSYEYDHNERYHATFWFSICLSKILRIGIHTKKNHSEVPRICAGFVVVCMKSTRANSIK